MVLAIECDGATYHSSATARDRDRLRQEHLERLGWTFHRIWSQDWFYHRERETARAVAAYEAAVTAADNGDRRPMRSAQPMDYASIAIPSPGRAVRRSGPCPIWIHGEGIDWYSDDELTALIRWIESDTLLRTEDELLAEVMRELGFKRRGSKITAALTAAIARARRPR
jgi:hypothetical protein